MLIAHQCVLTLANSDSTHVVCQLLIEESLSPWPPDEYLSHVRNIKDPACSPDREVLINNGGIMDRHLPASKLDELAPELLVGSKKRRSFQHIAGRYQFPFVRQSTSIENQMQFL
jgi:hypothetical protein